MISPSERKWLSGFNVNQNVKWCLAMKWHKISKDCPCRKGECCVNGLKCDKKNCFLLKGWRAEKEDIYFTNSSIFRQDAI